MLYPTHHPFFFPFNPLTNPTLYPSPTTLPSPIPVEQSMDCVEADLKTSFGPPKKVQPRPQAFSDESPEAVNGVSGDEFFVDDLLDFSKEGAEEGFFGIKEDDQDQDPDNTTKSCSVSISLQEQKQSNKTSFDFGCSELSVPAEDAASLEWLSHFVEDSFSNYSVPFPAGKSPEKPVENQSKPLEAKPCFSTPVQTKARSKRSRTGFRVWSLGSTSESSTSSSSTTSSDSILGLPPPPPEAKKQKRRKGETGGGAQQPRRCSHCLVQKTPQWRAGPLGAKTLCNACGVRFKSGRLLPEYRPACSPTFLSDVHSNNHRKVMEMRRKKESEPGSGQPVQSF
ncbi:GATA transcription factor [Actinidia chinensis var. chinensis]|uniref:GATA transcription factor n=1 Tax=Actinidia chinensis var. chinensis TaxID=1590841 RepID=A0A2R6R5S8_ACTCC|nr:GATA transcription factor [Actinidia chinensis var. chinensis]